MASFEVFGETCFKKKEVVYFYEVQQISDSSPKRCRCSWILYVACCDVRSIFLTYFGLCFIKGLVSWEFCSVIYAHNFRVLVEVC